MYKLLLFLKKSNDDQTLEHFNNFTLKHLSDLAGKEIKVADVESSLLLDQKYNKFIEFATETKEEMDKLMSTNPGRALNKDLMDYHQDVDIIFVNYPTEEKI